MKEKIAIVLVLFSFFVFQTKELFSSDAKSGNYFSLSHYQKARNQTVWDLAAANPRSINLARMSSANSGIPSSGVWPARFTLLVCHLFDSEN